MLAIQLSEIVNQREKNKTWFINMWNGETNIWIGVSLITLEGVTQKIDLKANSNECEIVFDINKIKKQE